MMKHFSKKETRQLAPSSRRTSYHQPILNFISSYDFVCLISNYFTLSLGLFRVSTVVSRQDFIRCVLCREPETVHPDEGVV
jgi:hypothetical protein